MEVSGLGCIPGDDIRDNLKRAQLLSEPGLSSYLLNISEGCMERGN